MSPLRILVTGSRLLANSPRNRAIIRADLLEALTLSTIGTPVLVHGKQVSQDPKTQLPHGPLGIDRCPADWDRYGRAAGPLRNAAMVARGAAIGYAYPIGESRGTRNCLRLAREAWIRMTVRDDLDAHAVAA